MSDVVKRTTVDRVLEIFSHILKVVPERRRETVITLNKAVKSIGMSYVHVLKTMKSTFDSINSIKSYKNTNLSSDFQPKAADILVLTFVFMPSLYHSLKLWYRDYLHSDPKQA